MRPRQEAIIRNLFPVLIISFTLTTKKQEAFEVSNSEEEEDEEDESCHSSSSDTLTCSLPEVNLKKMNGSSF